MQVIVGSGSIAEEHGPFVVGIGVFDGVHLGHQKLLEKVLELARQEQVASLAYTFHPHPASVLNPALAPKLIEPLEVRLERIAALGLSATLVEEFNMSYASIEPAEFVQAILVEKLKARHVVVGANFTFGRKAAGNLQMLQELGAQHGFGVHGVGLLRADGIAVSSTKVREFVSAGKMQGARLLLGRCFAISGVVTRGAGRGRDLGFATANLQVEGQLLPAVGVYAARAYGPVDSGIVGMPTVVSVGYNPTFAQSGDIKIEAHLLDYSGAPLYSSTLTLDFVQRVRDERRFPSVEALQEQVREDIAAAREILAADGP